MIRHKHKILLSVLVVLPMKSYSAELTLKEYLKEVEEKNQTIQSSKQALEGYESRKNESKLIFRPSVFAQAQTAVDKKPTNNVNAQGDRTDNTFATVGLMQQFEIGLKGKLSYNQAHTKIYDALPTFLPLSDYVDSNTTLELSQSLWRNFYGVEEKAQSNLIKSDAEAKKHTEEYKVKMILSNAESVYWSLSETNKILKVQKESLERAIKIRNWTNNRSNNGLGDRSDFLQSDANVKFREYELKTTEQQLKNLIRAFNSLRSIDSEVLTHSLENVQINYVQGLKLSNKAPLRDDTKAAIEYEKLAKANLNLSIERNKPTFEVYGAYALNGKDHERSKAISQGFTTDKTTTAIGVRFSAPLDFSNLIDNIRGYKKEQTSAELSVKQKLFDQDREWNDLTSKFEDAKNNLNLVLQIEEAQKVKSTNERDRLTNGRTTTFQALNFEQDYAQSELLRIKSELEILNIYSQSKTFVSGGNE